MTEAEAALRVLAEQVQVLQQQLAEQQQVMTQQRAALAEQQHAMVQQHDEYDQRLAAQQAEISVFRSERATALITRRVATGRTGTRRGAHRGQWASRRSLLKWGGAAAAAASMALVAAKTPVAQAAPAADGGSLLIGTANLGTSQTSLAITGTSSASPFFQVDASNSTSSLPVAIGGVCNATSGTAVSGSSSGGIGVLGISGSISDVSSSSGVGVYGITDNSGASGVLGTTDSTGNGVEGDSWGGSGVAGNSDLGTGVAGSSISGLGGMFTGGLAPIALGPGSTAGSPSTGTHTHGEIYLDLNVAMWVCTTGGTPGTWAKMAQVSPGITMGGAVTYLSRPVRLLDSRPGATDALNNGGGPYPTGSTTSLTIAGDMFNGVTVPASAVGAFGNVTVVTSSGANGYVAIVPHGAGFSGTSSVNYSSGGQVIANFFNVGLASGGIDIIVGGVGSTNVIIDVFAVVA